MKLLIFFLFTYLFQGSLFAFNIEATENQIKIENDVYIDTKGVYTGLDKIHGAKFIKSSYPEIYFNQNTITCGFELASYSAEVSINTKTNLKQEKSKTKPQNTGKLNKKTQKIAARVEYKNEPFYPNQYPNHKNTLTVASATTSFASAAHAKQKTPTALCLLNCYFDNQLPERKEEKYNCLEKNIIAHTLAIFHCNRPPPSVS